MSEANISPELLQALSAMMASALQTTVANMGAGSNETSSTIRRTPPFAMTEFRATEGTSVEDYFNRFQWALELSKIPENQFANYARVHMGSELNNALKFLVSPQLPEDVSYVELRATLIAHFDRAKNKYAESIRFRLISQHREESIASFALRLRQGAAHCEYGEFLDRMLIEQLLHGLRSREMCDEIVAKKPSTFAEAYEIANTLEATHKTTNVVKNTELPSQESTYKLGVTSPRIKHDKRLRQRSSSRGSRSQDGRAASSQRRWTESSVHNSCNSCGGQHLRNRCRYRNAICNLCQKQGHLARVCRSKGPRAEARVVASLQSIEPIDTIDTINAVYIIDKVKAVNSLQKNIIDVSINGKVVQMEVDTGAPCGIISVNTLRKIKPKYTLEKTDRQFVSYTGHRIPCVGRIEVKVKIGQTTRKLNLYIVKGRFDSLFGREWISNFAHELDFKQLFATSDTVHTINSATPNLTSNQQAQLRQLLAKHDNIFSDIAGTLNGPPVSLHLKPEASPVFARAREIPIALRDKYANEIDKKIASGFYKRVDYSEWASTTHVVVKKNGQLRITGNYKPTLNPQIIVDEHPIPRTEHIFSQLKNAKLFCHLDITDAYSHLVLDDEFAHALTLNTPTHGLIRPTRAVYGAASIPAIWQRRMEIVLQDLPNVKNFYDDILVFASDFDGLLQVLDETLERLKEQGLRLNRDKCVFATSAVEFLGHRVDALGIHKSDKHIQAIRDAPKPTTPEELQLFIGKATYYSTFIPDLSTKDRPLRDMLLKKPFEWTPAAEEAYEDIKKILISPQVLMPYDPNRPLILATDASKTGLGAVLSHRLQDGRERPIAYASRTLTATERKYPQIDKEALAIVWAAQKFFYYIYARHFTLVTDHKPLTQILHPEKSLPTLCISRMANYADYLSHFNYDVIFKPTHANANADYCSRMHLPTCRSEQRISLVKEEETGLDGFDNFVLHQVQQLPIRAEDIARETRRDTHLGKIVQQLESGQDLTRLGYKPPESNYRLSNGCLVFEHRIIIPSIFREAILNELHTAHLGIVKMKGMARSFVFWPGIDADIERVAKTCVNCARNAHEPPKTRSHHWEYPKGPWERIHLDYAGPIFGKMLLIVVDAYSKWLEVKVTSSTTTSATTSILEEIFSAYGSPITVVTDNGTQFTSSEFKAFLHKNGVKFHKKTAPYHPSTNGQAERCVQTVKDALKNMATTSASLQHDICQFLRQYRKAPHATTGQSPSALFLGRSIRTNLDLVRPDETNVKITQKQQAAVNTMFREFHPKQQVYFLSGNPRTDKWLPGIVVTRLGDLHYEIEYLGKKFKRHVDQIKNRFTCKIRAQQTDPLKHKEPIERQRRVHFYDNNYDDNNDTPVITPSTSPENASENDYQSYISLSSGFSTPITSPNSSPTILRRSARVRRPPQRFVPGKH